MRTICMIVQGVYDSDPRVRRKAEALVAAGYAVDVLALQPPSGQRDYTLNEVSVRTLALGKARGSLLRYFYEYFAFFLWVLVRVSVQMSRRHYCVVDVNTLPDFLVFAPVFARYMGAKIVLDMHEITPEFYMSKYGSARDSWSIRLLEFLERISFRFADHVITINEPILTLLEKRGLDRSRSTVIMNAADEARFAKVLASRGTGAASGGPFVMMYHGTLTKIYGLDIAVEAFARAHVDMPGAELWILGSGTEAGPLGAQVKALGLESKVKLIGQVPPADIPSWLAMCSLGLLPLRQDVFLDFAFPNKLPEFIISDTPVMISRLKAIRHYFSPEALAYFDPNDPVDLGRQMVLVYGDSERRARMVVKAREEYASICWDVMKERYLAMIAGVAPTEAAAKRESGAAAART